jgi:glyoxylase-like metal-dependent hydrolase (beta-lactamase superfamily II)
VCFVADRVCFTGDLILGAGSTIVPPSGGSLAAYLDSLRRVGELDLELLCPGHGPYVTDPKRKIEEYVAHRLERERKLVVALEAGERSRARLLDLAWDDVPAELRPMAAIAMEAHLEKLEAEDRLPGDLRD